MNVPLFAGLLLLPFSFARLDSAIALSDSIGEAGINARKLHEAPHTLTGRKVVLGQLEIGRPGQFGVDKTAVGNPPLNLAGVFFRNLPALPNLHVDNHAAMVAAVMVSYDKKLPGVAPHARLFSSAVGTLSRSGQPEECLAAQHLAEQNNTQVRAINLSFGESLERDPREHASLDGNALLTQCLDWSAQHHNVLYVVAGNQGQGGIPIPTDQFNGITTAYTAKRQRQFTKVDFANLSAKPMGVGRRLIRREVNQGGRRGISLLAPGHKISVRKLNGQVAQVSGTSFAAPHVTGSIALLQEFSDRKLQTADPNWSLSARRHEVMKAILLNAAEKLQDTGDGRRLGMNRTILDKHNRTWLQSDAFQNSRIPLDIQMGAGQLEIYRALKQYQSGPLPPSEGLPARGWDYGTVDLERSQDYSLERPLLQDSFFVATLVWDRRVTLNDRNQNERYDLGETFKVGGLNDLNLYLLNTESQELSQAVCRSDSLVDNVEHLFCPIPQTGRYKLRVVYAQPAHELKQPYAIAWWGQAASTP
ncbi:MAG: S8 family serine peptidase [Cyanobacteria bacterium P01_H01_bin.15]